MTDKRKDQTRIINPQRSVSSLGPDLDNKSTQIRRGVIVAKLTVIDGPGKGTALPVFLGDNAVGRADQNRIALNFGDGTIYREAHAWIATSSEGFSIEHGGRANPVHVNGERVQKRRSITMGDQIKLGSTTLRLDPY